MCVNSAHVFMHVAHRTQHWVSSSAALHIILISEFVCCMSVCMYVDCACSWGHGWGPEVDVEIDSSAAPCSMNNKNAETDTAVES